MGVQSLIVCLIVLTKVRHHKIAVFYLLSYFMLVQFICVLSIRSLGIQGFEMYINANGDAYGNYSLLTRQKVAPIFPPKNVNGTTLSTGQYYPIEYALNVSAHFVHGEQWYRDARPVLFVIFNLPKSTSVSLWSLYTGCSIRLFIAAFTIQGWLHGRLARWHCSIGRAKMWLSASTMQ